MTRKGDDFGVRWNMRCVEKPPRTEPHTVLPVVPGPWFGPELHSAFDLGGHVVLFKSKLSRNRRRVGNKLIQQIRMSPDGKPKH